MNLTQLKTSYEAWLERSTRSLTTLLTTKYSLSILGAISFAESALPVPIITDPFMVAYIMAQKSKVIRGVLVTTISSVIGGLAAFLAAEYFSDAVLGFASEGTVAQFNLLVNTYADSASMLGFLGALTPIPFTTAAVVAGTLKANVFMFIIGAFIGRLIRYGITGYLTYYFGEVALAIAKRNALGISVIAVIVVALYLYFTL